MNGLSTLNRFLGRRQKDASRSTSNLSSQSSAHLDTSSQFKKIVPIVMKDAPFEQTFRVTVLLPKNQLYVERIGAKTKLDKLLDDICESKDLHRHKYEFRHPADNSQVFDNNKTIGEVGLNELRLTLKTESRYNDNFNRFHPNEMLRYKNQMSDSVSSSEMSRDCKIVLRKSSPYSSSNSLNSLDSTGMEASTTKMPPPVAPVRKKRAAPRPPSQNSIPEQETITTVNLNAFKEPLSIYSRKNFHVSSPNLYNNGFQHEHHKSNLSINNENRENNDTNNNINGSKIEEQPELQQRTDFSMNRINATAYNANNRPTSMFIISDNNESSSRSAIRSRTSSESSEIKALTSAKAHAAMKKRKAPPAPSPRAMPVPSPRTIQDHISDHSDESITDAKKSPDREVIEPVNNSVEQEMEIKTNVSKVMLNVAAKEDQQVDDDEMKRKNSPVSIQIVPEVEHEREKSKSPTKVMIKPDESISVIPEMSDSDEDESVVNVYNIKLARSCVTPEVPAPKVETIVEAIVHKEDVKQELIVNETQPEIKEVAKEEKKLQTESTEAKVETIPEKEKSPETVEEKEKEEEEPSPRPQSPLWTYKLPAAQTFADSNVTLTDPETTFGSKYYNDFTSTLDNETIISDNTTIISDVDIKPIIQERNIANQTLLFQTPLDLESNKSTDGTTDVITSDIEDGYYGDKGKSQETTSGIVETVQVHVQEIINSEDNTKLMSEFVAEERIVVRDVEPKKTEDPVKLEEELIVNDLVKTIKENFRLEVQNGFEQEAKVGYDTVDEKTLLESDKMQTQTAYEKRQNQENISRSIELNQKPNDGVVETINRISIKSISNSPAKMIVRSDSFHSIGQQIGTRIGNTPNKTRSTSFVSLINAQKVENRLTLSNGNINSNAKKSSSELSISDSPSLQSLEVLKSILNTPRKSSLREEIVETKETVTTPPTPITTPVKSSEVKEVETSKWKYQGPPKINLTTWSERPKIEVSIKSDNDYKFGGSATLPRGFKNQQTITIRGSDRVDSAGDHGGKMNDQHNPNDQENRLPKVLGVEYKKNVSSVHLRDETASKTVVNIKPRPMSMDAAKLWSQPAVNYQTTTISFNRLSTNHNKFVPVVHGFKLNDINENPVTSEEEIQHVHAKPKVPPAVPEKPNYLRSSSAGDVQKKYRFSSYESRPNDVDIQHQQSQDMPFSQNTLRRTGLKEKILSTDKETESIFGRVIEPKQQQMKITSTQSSAPPPPPPAPKPVPIVKSVVGKKPMSPMNDVDPRTILMDSIKNFNKNSLRKK